MTTSADARPGTVRCPVGIFRDQPGAVRCPADFTRMEQMSRCSGVYITLFWVKSFAIHVVVVAVIVVFVVVHVLILV